MLITANKLDRTDENDLDTTSTMFQPQDQIGFNIFNRTHQESLSGTDEGTGN